jgi:hypothetical protein
MYGGTQMLKELTKTEQTGQTMAQERKSKASQYKESLTADSASIGIAIAKTNAKCGHLVSQSQRGELRITCPFHVA